jgi:thymidylate synthase
LIESNYLFKAILFLTGMRQYIEHSERILTRGGYKPNRTGIDSISLFGYQNEYDLSEGFPLLTTKKMSIKGITHELIWFLRGDSNIKYLVDNDVHIWDGNSFQHHLKKNGKDSELKMYSPGWHSAFKDYIARIKEDEEFAREHGDLGPVYGKQWRHWKTSDGKEIDQITDAINLLRKSPQSRRNIVTAWKPEEVASMALPPCHSFFHMNVLDGKLDLQLYQRSCDMFLGVPFNIASYAMLTQILAQQAELAPGRFVHTFGDSHFYCGADERGRWYGDNLEDFRKRTACEHSCDLLDWLNKELPAETQGKEGQDHVSAIAEQFTRAPRKLPRLKIANKRFDQLEIGDFELIDYYSHPPIKRAMAV